MTYSNTRTTRHTTISFAASDSRAIPNPGIATQTVSRTAAHFPPLPLTQCIPDEAISVRVTPQSNPYCNSTLPLSPPPPSPPLHEFQVAEPG